MKTEKDLQDGLRKADQYEKEQSGEARPRRVRLDSIPRGAMVSVRGVMQSGLVLETDGEGYVTINNDALLVAVE